MTIDPASSRCMHRAELPWCMLLLKINRCQDKNGRIGSVAVYR